MDSAHEPQVVETGGLVGPSSESVQAELQGLSQQEAIHVLSAQLLSLRTELARRGRDNIGPGTSTPIHPGVQRDEEYFEQETATPKFGQVLEQISTEPHVFYEYLFGAKTPRLNSRPKCRPVDGRRLDEIDFH